MSPTALSVRAADDDLWQQYTSLATRSYGHPVEDLPRLRQYADAQVALRDGRVVAGGLGLLVPQYFGGRTVPAAFLSGGCVAPEERGNQLAAWMLTQRLRPLQEQGAVLATVWTASTDYARRLGFHAPTEVFSWTVPTADLSRVADTSGERETEVEVTHGLTEAARRGQRDLAAAWNGPWQRPPWWDQWQQDAHPGLDTYSFTTPGAGPAGMMSLAVNSLDGGDRQLTVHDFWADDDRMAAGMFRFLARYASRIPTVAFQRTGLPPAALLPHALRRAGAATARAWHPWMLRVLDLEQAVRLRGWPQHLDVALPIEVAADPAHPRQRWTLVITGGKGELGPSTRAGEVTLTRGQFAVWYAGGYRSAAAAALGGLRGVPDAVARLVAATCEAAPWLPEYF